MRRLKREICGRDASRSLIHSEALPADDLMWILDRDRPEGWVETVRSERYVALGDGMVLFAALFHRLHMRIIIVLGVIVELRRGGSRMWSGKA